MSKQYKTYKDALSTELIVVIDGDSIGWCHKDNAEYLAWVAEGNTAEEWNPDAPPVEETPVEPITEPEPVIEETPVESENP